MIGYKIHYGEYEHDCWGKSEWCGWYEYDDNIYTDKLNADKALMEAKELYPYRDFEIYEVEIK